MGREPSQSVAGDLDARAGIDRFLDGIEHDLRNPMNTLGMVLGMLERGGAAGDMIARAQRACDRLMEMGAQLSAFGRVELGSGLDVRRQPVLVEEIARGAVPEDARVRFRSHGDTAGRFDGDLVTRAIAELVNNGIDHGGGAVDVVTSGDAESVRVTVESPAPIDDELAPLVFDPRQRPADKRTKPARGLGLGLYCARAVARAHGGELSLERHDGPTRFVLTLPRLADSSRKSDV